MFIKNLRISTPYQIIRDIPFRIGMNLIIDESSEHITGNNVGKTTVLRLIDFCLGADARKIYSDPENIKNEYKLVKDYLVDNNVMITLTLGCFENDKDDVVICRNFLKRKDASRLINGIQVAQKEFEHELSSKLLPDLKLEKPTFRQVISHNFRYSDSSITNTLKNLDGYTKDTEYETLYLYMFGCGFESGSDKQIILEKIKTENTYKNRLEKEKSKDEYEVSLDWINSQIEDLNLQKSQLNINKEFEKDLEYLNKIKYQINSLSTEITTLSVRKEIVIEARDDFDQQKSDIDVSQLNAIYQQAKSFIPELQKKFEDLVNYHNQMIVEKIKFITADLPAIEKKLADKHIQLDQLLKKEELLSYKLTQSDTFEDLEHIITRLNERFQKKGEYENIISQISSVDTKIKEYNNRLKQIEEGLFSDEFESKVKSQLRTFNKIFAQMSNKLYGEPYAIIHPIKTNKLGQKFYDFRAWNDNHSSGKKQGEISCFDIAYTLFADKENISCLHFILNDKKELVHDNQLIEIAQLVEDKNIQFVASILRDKLPLELNNEEFFILKLSQDDKLFRIG